MKALINKSIELSHLLNKIFMVKLNDKPTAKMENILQEKFSDFSLYQITTKTVVKMI